MFGPYNHKHIEATCLGGHQFAYCHACRAQRCRNCGASEPQHNHPIPTPTPRVPRKFGPNEWFGDARNTSYTHEPHDGLGYA